MSAVSAAIREINDHLGEQLRVVYGNICTHGLAELRRLSVDDDSQMVPVIYNQYGDAQKITLPDDGNDFTCYHRVVAPVIVSDAGAARGFRDAARANFAMRLVVEAKRLSHATEDFGLILANFLGGKYGHAQVTPTGLITDGLDLWQDERNIGEFLVKTNRYYLAVNYTLSVPASQCPDLC